MNKDVLHKIIIAAIIVFVALMLNSCIESKYVPRQFYMLNIKYGKKIKYRRMNKSVTSVLKIDDVSIVPQFENSSFVYRVNEFNYFSDYYNAFFVSPVNQIYQCMLRYFGKTKMFSIVVGQNSKLSAQYILNAKILSLYADYRNKMSPKAVIAIKFVLLRYRHGKYHILLNSVYSQNIPLIDKTSKNLVASWSRGLSIMLRKLTVNINRFS